MTIKKSNITKLYVSQSWEIFKAADEKFWYQLYLKYCRSSPELSNTENHNSTENILKQKNAASLSWLVWVFHRS